MLCLSGFELYSRWVPLMIAYLQGGFLFLVSFFVSLSKKTVRRTVEPRLNKKTMGERQSLSYWAIAHSSPLKNSIKLHSP